MVNGSNYANINNTWVVSGKDTPNIFPCCSGPTGTTDCPPSSDDCTSWNLGTSCWQDTTTSKPHFLCCGKETSIGSGQYTPINLNPSQGQSYDATCKEINGTVMGGGGQPSKSPCTCFGNGVCSGGSCTCDYPYILGTSDLCDQKQQINHGYKCDKTLRACGNSNGCPDKPNCVISVDKGCHATTADCKSISCTSGTACSEDQAALPIDGTCSCDIGMQNCTYTGTSCCSGGCWVDPMYSSVPLPYCCACSDGANCSNTGSCFTADALVTLVDGSQKPISTIKQGDIVLSAKGGPTKVMILDIEEVGDREIVGFNNNTPFITADHCFIKGNSNIRLTFDPVGSSNSKHWDALEQIEDGTELVSIKGTFRVSEITKIKQPPETKVYDLITSDHTYIVNNIHVYDDFPDIENNILSSMVIMKLSEIADTYDLSHIKNKWDCKKMTHSFYTQNIDTAVEKVRDEVKDWTKEQIAEAVPTKLMEYVELINQNDILLHLGSDIWRHYLPTINTIMC